MRAVDLIIKKRDATELNAAEIEFLIQGYVTGDIPDYQIAALLMAVYFRGMTPGETMLLTRAMLASGKTLDLSRVHGSKIDKHSTGGVGDKISLVLAPLAAALGLKVPMMAGRGLGHTGGTLDKLESIPGYTTTLSESRFLEALETIGYAVIGQSEAIAPADKLLYALRDVTGTVESVPLITASILSKKCAEGAAGLVFDVKYGSGAFMKTPESAGILAQSLVSIGSLLGKRIKAVLTNMDQPLGYAVGNFLEVKEAAACLQGKGPADIVELTCRFTAEMLILAGMEKNVADASARCRAALADGTAWKKFEANIRFQGGNPDCLHDPGPAPAAAYQLDYLCPGTGYIIKIDAYLTGMLCVLLGAGRAKKGDPVSPGAGIIFRKKCGDTVTKGECICTFHADDKALFVQAGSLMTQALVIANEPAVPSPLVLKEY